MFSFVAYLKEEFEMILQIVWSILVLSSFNTLQQRNSHYQVPQSSLKSKPVPPPKPGHLKVVRALSHQETKAVPERQRKFSDADAINRVPPPNVPPPVRIINFCGK